MFLNETEEMSVLRYTADLVNSAEFVDSDTVERRLKAYCVTAVHSV